MFSSDSSDLFLLSKYFCIENDLFLEGQTICERKLVSVKLNTFFKI